LIVMDLRWDVEREESELIPNSCSLSPNELTYGIIVRPISFKTNQKYLLSQSFTRSLKKWDWMWWKQAHENESESECEWEWGWE
jgi:hypothetical protein